MNIDKHGIKHDTIRTSYTEVIESRYLSAYGDGLAEIPLIPRRKNMTVRGISGLVRTAEGVLCVNTRNWRGKCEFVENEVTPECWDEIFTPARLRKLRLKPALAPRQAYRFNGDEDYTLVRSKTGKSYDVGCQRITRRALIALCRAILEDEGEL